MSVEVEVGGERVFASTGGRSFDRGLPAVALLHGSGNDHTVWALQARSLAARGRAVLALDLPGHGRSGGVPLDQVELMAEWLLTVLDTIGVAEVALAGHSLGAAVALETVAMAGERVTGLGLVATAALVDVHPDLMTAAAEHRHLASELIADWSHLRGGAVGSPVPGHWPPGLTLRLNERALAGPLRADLEASAEYRGAMDATATVTCPTVVILGSDDRMVPAARGRELAAAIPRATVVEIAGGHQLTVEHPDAVTGALLLVI
jgi:pimeloyl-ACP methyl ester carboxylesterase